MCLKVTILYLHAPFGSFGVRVKHRLGIFLAVNDLPSPDWLTGGL